MALREPFSGYPPAPGPIPRRETPLPGSALNGVAFIGAKAFAIVPGHTAMKPGDTQAQASALSGGR
jgi:hypothetical protein